MSVPHEAGERDEAGSADNSLDRLVALADGVFAIAMTLLALDLRAPELGSHSSEDQLVHALLQSSDSYWSYLLTFIVIARYWNRHRRLVRSVVRLHAAIVRDTLMLLLLVAALPFPASLLGRYAGEPISLAVYGAVNALATACLMLLSWDVKRLRLADHEPSGADDYTRSWQGWLGLTKFVLCVPAAFAGGSYGRFVLVLLIVPERVDFWRRLARSLRRRPA